MIRQRVVVHGRVQGVFFRDECSRQARRHGVGGWVQNRPDGTVEAVFEGSTEEVAQMCEWCRSGPPQAVVERLETHDEDPRGETDFTVR